MLSSRSHHLRSIFRTLDTEKKGSITLSRFRDRVVRFFNLESRPEDVAALDSLLRSADTDASGCLDFKEFAAAISNSGRCAAAADPVLEGERFNRPGVIDKKLAALLANEGCLDLGKGTRRPCGDLGMAWTSPPYAVLGDAERMLAMESGYLNSRTERLKKFFVECDTDGSGLLSHAEFRAGLRQLCPQASKLHIDELIRTLDEDARGNVNLEEFLSRFSLDFMKKPSQQGSPGSSNILLWPASLKRGGPVPEPLSRRLRHAPAPRAHTRAEALRRLETQRQLREYDSPRAERMRMPPISARR